MALFAPQDLDRYKALSAQLEDMRQHQVKQNAAASAAQVKQAQAALQQASAALQRTRGAEAEAEKQAEKLKGWYPGKHLGNHEKKQAESDEMLAKLKQKDATEAAAIADLQQKLAGAQQLASAWAAKAQEMAGVEREHAALVEAMFNAPVWSGDANLASAAAAIADLQRQAGESSGHGNTYRRAEQLMRSADQKLAQAQQAMGRAQGMAGMEMVGNIRPLGPMGGPIGGRRNPMMNMMEMGTVRRSNDMVQSAAQDIAMARQVLPTLPWVAEASLDSAKKGIFQNMLFGGIMSDMAQIAMIKKAMGEIAEMRGATKQSLEWVAANTRAFEGAAQAVAAQARVAAKQAEMRAFKEGKLREALAAA